QWCLLFLLTIDLVVLACGNRLWIVGGFPRNASMPATLFLGSVLAWTAAATVTVLLCHRLRAVWLMHHLQPNRRRRPMLKVAGDLSRRERRALRESLQVLGWQARFSRRPLRPGELAVELTETQLFELRISDSGCHSPEQLRRVLGVENLKRWK